MINSFGTSTESNSLYAGDTTAFVKAVYSNVLNRAPQAAGLSFWINAIDSGTLTKGNAALSIMAGALVNITAQGLIDTAAINNKITIASRFTSAITTTDQINGYKGSAAAASARAMLGTVTNTTNTSTFQITIPTMPALYTPPVAAVGDYYTYHSTSSTSSNYFRTEADAVVNGNGTVARTFTYSIMSKWIVTYDANGASVSETNEESDQICTYAPAYASLPKTLSVGLTWSTASTYSCKGQSTPVSYTVDLTNVGSVTGIESVTVPAGTFNALRLAYKATSTTSTSISVTDGYCWRDTVSGRNVYCTSSIVTTTTTIPNNIRNTFLVDELVSYASANPIKKKFSVTSYAGDWSGTYTGSDAGNCTMNITIDGLLSGSCSGGAAGTFAISGSANDQGVLTFSLNGAGLSSTTFTGTLTSPNVLNGIWLTSTGQSGSWSIAHN